MRVREVWFWRKDRFEIHVLDPALGSYHAQATSPLVPGLDLDELAEFVRMPRQSAAVAAFRDRLRAR